MSMMTRGRQIKARRHIGFHSIKLSYIDGGDDEVDASEVLAAVILRLGEQPQPVRGYFPGTICVPPAELRVCRPQPYEATPEGDVLPWRPHLR